MNKAYSDLTSKIFNVVNKVAPTNTMIISNSTNEWFDGEIAEKIAVRDKLFRKFKKSKLSVDEIYKKTDLTDKQAATTSICLNTKKESIFSPRTIANTFKKHFANLGSDFVKKLPDPTGKFGIPSVCQYYKGVNFR